jgi:hypothetical protein
MPRRPIHTRPPPSPDGKLWDNKLGWIPYDKKVCAAKLRLVYQNVPHWRDDPSYDLVKQVKAKAKRKAVTVKRRTAAAAKRKALLVDRGCDPS